MIFRVTIHCFCRYLPLIYLPLIYFIRFSRCGISRIWVAPQYRRHGIAAKLVTSIRGHFVFGAFLSFDEIAFSSPTEDGKRFAAKLAQRTDFLIYEN